jgi:fructan beta-fructosidase
MFELAVEGEAGKQRWVLVVNINPGGAAGGSGAEYFVGNFDGKTFTNDNPPDRKLFVDYGKDFYAAVSFSDLPKTDGRRILIGWMSNWQYALKEPTEPWRTAQSIPRALSLRRTADGLRIAQRPIDELKTLRGQAFSKRNLLLTGKKIQLPLSGEALEISGEFLVGKDSGALLHLRAGTSETIVGYDAAKQVLFIDRTKSGAVDFDSNFSGRHEAPLSAPQNRVKLHLLVDRSSVEVFANDGEAAITDRIFPPSSDQRLELSGYGTQARCLAIDVWKLNSVWRP